MNPIHRPSSLTAILLSTPRVIPGFRSLQHRRPPHGDQQDVGCLQVSWETWYVSMHQPTSLQRRRPVCATIRRRDVASQQELRFPCPWFRVLLPQVHWGDANRTSSEQLLSAVFAGLIMFCVDLMTTPPEPSTSSTRHLPTGDNLAADHAAAGRTSSARTHSK